MTPLLVLVASSIGAQSTTPELSILVRPVRDTGTEVTAVEFRAELRGFVDQGARPFSVQSPITYAGRTGIADRVANLVVTDSSGVVPVTIENDPVNRGGFPFYRHWRAGRRVVAPVVVTYRMLSFTGTATVGPQFDFYSHGGGISGGGMALFVLPENVGPATLRVKWDLSRLAPGSVAASTYGEGDFELRGPPERLAQAYYMAGPLGRYSPPGASGFHAYWLGETQFDASKEMVWTHQAYEFLRKFYRDTTASSYRVFVRAMRGSGGGTALQNSFMLGTAPRTRDSVVAGPRGTLAHEMGHMFVGGLSGGGQAGATWFQEGLNVYYTRLLLLRSGLGSVADYERDLNGSARGYFASPFRNASADSLARLGFSTGIGGGSAQNVAYTRGSLYFAHIDAKIRAASDGKRKLDDVMLPLFDRRRRGEAIDQNALIDALVREVGPSARDEFQAVIVRGETLTPDANAFGPCFSRKSVKHTVNGAEVDGFDWVRVASIPDERCREW